MVWLHVSWLDRTLLLRCSGALPTERVTSIAGELCGVPTQLIPALRLSDDGIELRPELSLRQNYVRNHAQLRLVVKSDEE
jgi:hypothetical protein